MNNKFNHTVIIHNNNESLTVVRTTKFFFGIFVFCFVFVIKQLSVFFMSCFCANVTYNTVKMNTGINYSMNY